MFDLYAHACISSLLQTPSTLPILTVPRMLCKGLFCVYRLQTHTPNNACTEHIHTTRWRVERERKYSQNSHLILVFLPVVVSHNLRQFRQSVLQGRHPTLLTLQGEGHTHEHTNTCTHTYIRTYTYIRQTQTHVRSHIHTCHNICTLPSKSKKECIQTILKW